MSEQHPVPKVMAIMRVSRCPCSQVNGHGHGLALLLLCVQRRGHLRRSRWKGRPPSPTGQPHSFAPEVLSPLDHLKEP